MKPERSHRIIISLLIALAGGVTCFFALNHFALGGGDFEWSYYAGQDLLTGRDPYRPPSNPVWVPYPLPAAFVGILFSPLRIDIAAAVFFGASSGLLAFGLTRQSYVGLLACLSCPYWVSLLYAQWTPLIVASAFLPVLMGVLVIKPHIAMPVVLTRLKWSGVLSCAVLVVISLIIYPTWPIKWVSQLAGFDRYYPLFSILGPLLLLALKRHGDPDARFLLLASLFPQRWFYDALILWLIPKTRKEFLYVGLASWGAYLWWLYHMPISTLELGVICVLFFYLPMLIIILVRPAATVNNSDVVHNLHFDC